MTAGTYTWLGRALVATACVAVFLIIGYSSRDDDLALTIAAIGTPLFVLAALALDLRGGQRSWRYSKVAVALPLAAVAGMALSGAFGDVAQRVVGIPTSIALTIFLFGGALKFARDMRAGWREGSR
jgi:FtsH-binding integral membrane protein